MRQGPREEPQVALDETEREQETGEAQRHLRAVADQRPVRARLEPVDRAGQVPQDRHASARGASEEAAVEPEHDLRQHRRQEAAQRILPLEKIAPATLEELYDLVELAPAD